MGDQATAPESKWELLAELCRESREFPALTLACEFATYGAVLDFLVGGRSGVDRYRAAMVRDTEVYIPLYTATLKAFLSGVPKEGALDRLVDLAAEHDRLENEFLLSAFDRLDPPNGGQPDVPGATPYASLARVHATRKFGLLLAPVAVALAAVPLHSLDWALGKLGMEAA